MIRMMMLAMLMAGTLLAQPRYTIQVLSVQERTSITPNFVQKMKTLDLPYTTYEKEGKHVVCIGDFSSEKMADDALLKVKETLGEGAFVTTLDQPMPDRTALTPDAQMQQAIVMAKARTLQKIEEEPAEESNMPALEPVEAKQSPQRTEDKPVATHEQSDNAEKTEAKEEYCKPTKKALRESEIADAISFYRNSRYYSFKP